MFTPEVGVFSANKHGRNLEIMEETTQQVRADEIHTLLEHFSRNTYRVKGDLKVIF